MRAREVWLFPANGCHTAVIMSKTCWPAAVEVVSLNRSGWNNGYNLRPAEGVHFANALERGMKRDIIQETGPEKSFDKPPSFRENKPETYAASCMAGNKKSRFLV